MPRLHTSSLWSVDDPPPPNLSPCPTTPPPLAALNASSHTAQSSGNLATAGSKGKNPVRTSTSKSAEAVVAVLTADRVRADEVVCCDVDGERREAGGAVWLGASERKCDAGSDGDMVDVVVVMVMSVVSDVELLMSMSISWRT
jgi:hypothetical protein